MTNILEYTNNIRNRKNGLTIVLTHGDMDGLVSAIQIKRHIDIINDMSKKQCGDWNEYIILSDLKVSPEHTYNMLKIACKWAGITPEDLNHKDSIYILDRPTFRKEDAEHLSRDIFYVAIDHHETSVLHHKEIASRFILNKTLINASPERCGATLSNDFLRLVHGYAHSEPYELIAKITNQWDTFLWTKSDDSSVRHNALALQACDRVFGNTLVWKYLKKAEYESMNAIVDASRGVYNDMWDYFSKWAYTAYDIFFSKLDDIYKLVNYHLKSNTFGVYQDGKEYGCAVLHGMEDYQSMLAQRLFENHSELDIIVYYNISGTISIRTRETCPIKANLLAVALGEFHGYSGGGHPNAAGGRINDPDEFKDKLHHKLMEALKSAFESVREVNENEPYNSANI